MRKTLAHIYLYTFVIVVIGGIVTFVVIDVYQRYGVVGIMGLVGFILSIAILIWAASEIKK